MKIAVVTGASKGIGQAIAIQLAQSEYHVIGSYNSDKVGGKATRNQIRKNGGNCTIYKLDIRNRGSIKRFCSHIQKYRKVDLLVNNAGIDYDIQFDKYPIDKMREVIEVNLIGAMTLTQEMLPYLKCSENSPQVINIASRMAEAKLIPGVSAYSPSKAGLVRFTQSLALECKDYGIRANAVCPGFTPTNAYKKIFPAPGELEKVVKELSANNPCRRVGRVEDVAHMVDFLASERGSYINGESILIDGGSSLG